MRERESEKARERELLHRIHCLGKLLIKNQGVYPLVPSSVALKDMRRRSDSDKNSRCLRSIAIGRRVCPQQDFLAAMRSVASSSDSDNNSRCLRSAGFSSSSDSDKNPDACAQQDIQHHRILTRIPDACAQQDFLYSSRGEIKAAASSGISAFALGGQSQKS